MRANYYGAKLIRRRAGHRTWSVHVVVAHRFQHDAERVQPKHREVGRWILRERLRRVQHLAAGPLDELMDALNR